jgi:hypothetical protein
VSTAISTVDTVVDREAALLCFEITEGRKHGIPLNRIEVEGGFRMAIRMDHCGKEAGRVIYLEEGWSKEYVTLAQKYPPEVYGNLRLRRASYNEQTGELIHAPRYRKGHEWNAALVLIRTANAPGTRAQCNWGPGVEVVHDGFHEKLVVLQPGAGFKLTRYGQLEPDQKKHLAFFWDWDLRLREVPIYYSKNYRG